MARNSRKQDNPFTPGLGMMPAYFSGREREIEYIDLALNRARSAFKPKKGVKALVGPLLALVGPRGIGKTLLLSIATEMALEKKIQVVELTEADIKSGLDNLLRQILPDNLFEEFFKKHPIKDKGKVSDYLKLELHPYSGDAMRFIHEAISARLEKGPLLISIDEAHALSNEFISDFYQQTQKLMRRRHPLCVILAGTPSIKRHRSEAGLKLSERTEFLDFNLLSDAETKDAFVNAFMSVDMTIEPNALKRLVKWSDNYPYFVQKSGFCTWHSIEHYSNKGSITMEDVDKGIRQATRERNSFYEGRVDELRKAGMYQVALKVVRLFKQSKGSMNSIALSNKMMGAMKELNEQSAFDLEQSLMDLGLLYKEESEISPGIPSLFNYIENHENKSTE